MTFTFVLLAFVVAAVTKFFWNGDLIAEPRSWVKAMISIPEPEREWGKVEGYVRRKLHQLIDCGICISFWVSGGVVGLHDWLIEPLPAPVWWWLGLWGAAISILEWTDGIRPIRLTKDE